MLFRSVSTLFATFMVSFSTNLFTMFSPLTQDPFMGAVFGGVLVAVGIGLVLRVGATTGGTDIVVKCLKLKALFKDRDYFFADRRSDYLYWRNCISKYGVSSL